MAADTETRDELAIDKRRDMVAALYLDENLSIRQIASRTGFSHGTIGNDIAFLRAEWRNRQSQNTEQWIAEELQKLAKTEAEAKAAWEKSKTPRTVETSKVSSGDKGGQQSAEKRIEHQYGDPAFLHVLIKVSERRSKLLGLDKPDKLMVLNWRDFLEGLDEGGRDLLGEEVDRLLASGSGEVLVLPAVENESTTVDAGGGHAAGPVAVESPRVEVEAEAVPVQPASGEDGGGCDTGPRPLFG